MSKFCLFVKNGTRLKSAKHAKFKAENAQFIFV